MARLRLEIPDLSDEDVQRLIAALAGVVPGVDLKIEVETDMAKAAVKTKARRETLTAKAAAPTAKKPGRPRAKVGKKSGTLYLDLAVWEALERVKTQNLEEGISTTANRLLRKALGLDG